MPPHLGRAIGPVLKRRLDTFPVVVVTGARQTGKSTLARHVGGAARRYLSLDSIAVRGQARDAPDELLRQSPRLTIDEVQREPQLLLGVKEEVDERRSPGRFLLIGSANLLVMKAVAESLAGRAAYLTLWPLSRREKLGLAECGAWSVFFDNKPDAWPAALSPDPEPGSDWRELAREGGLPVPGHELRHDPRARAEWFDGYTQTYLERDLRDLAAVQDLAGYQRLMTAAALRVGGILSISDLARDVGLANTTAQRYLDLLNVSYQLVLLPAFSVNRTTRLVKRPKLYWSDTGLAVHLAGSATLTGSHLENLVLQDLLVWKELQAGRPQLRHWRTHQDAEVDFVVDWKHRALPVEVKSSKRVAYADTRHLRAFLADHPRMAPGGVVLYDGDETYWVAERVLAIPWGRVI